MRLKIYVYPKTRRVTSRRVCKRFLRFCNKCRGVTKYDGDVKRIVFNQAPQSRTCAEIAVLAGDAGVCDSPAKVYPTARAFTRNPQVRLRRRFCVHRVDCARVAQQQAIDRRTCGRYAQLTNVGVQKKQFEHCFLLYAPQHLTKSLFYSSSKSFLASSMILGELVGGTSS